LLSMALWRTPVVALMPDVTPSPFRSQANGIINFMGGIGAIIAFLVGSSLYRSNPAFPFWMGSGLVIFAALLVLIFIKEPKSYEEGKQEASVFKSLREAIDDNDKSAIRLFGAIFFWFIGYNAIEAFFTLYSVNQLRLDAADSASLLGHLSLFFVLFALVSGFLGGKFGRRVTISTGIIGLGALIGVMFVLPPEVLSTPLTKLPVLGTVRVASLFMMGAGIAWALININSLPMVVDMVEDARIGTYTGLYYLFSTLAAIAGPNVNGWVIQLTGNNYNTIMLVAPIFMVLALLLMLGVRRGEAKVSLGSGELSVKGSSINPV
jgi:maltose/moltooligosaccharide transporter